SSDRLLGRAFSYAIDALQKLGANPNYTLQGNRSNNSSSSKFLKQKAAELTDSYSEFESVENFDFWIKGLNWNSPWTAGDQINARLSVMNSLPASRLDSIKIVMWEFLDSIRSTTTGLWGNNSSSRNYEYIS